MTPLRGGAGEARHVPPEAPHSRYDAQMLALPPEKGQPGAQHKLPAGSTYGFKMIITLPEYNLDKLAEADCVHYDRNAANDYEGDIDERVNLILPPSASKAPSTLSSTSTKPTPPPPDRPPQGRAGRTEGSHKVRQVRKGNGENVQ